ncbi:hypothetical protein BH11GEM1_BH11GEM1_22920 [soil metagenome]
MSERTTRPAVATALAFIALLGSAREGVSQQPPSAPTKDSSAMEMEVRHGFFTHEGLPDAVGSFSLRTAALARAVGTQRNARSSAMGARRKRSP